MALWVAIFCTGMEKWFRSKLLVLFVSEAFFFGFHFSSHSNSHALVTWIPGEWKKNATHKINLKKRRELSYFLWVLCVCMSFSTVVLIQIHYLNWLWFWCFFFYLFRLHRRICWASNKLSHSIVLLACLFGGLYVHLVFMLLVDCEWFVSRMLNQIKSTLKSNRNFHLVVIWIAIPIVVFIVFQAFSNHWFLPQSSPTIITYSIFK